MKKVFIATATAALMAMQSAFAIPTLTISDNNGHSVTVSDASGVVTYNGVVGNWTINVTTGIASPPDTSFGVHTVKQPHLDLNSINAFGGGAGNVLTITFTADNLGPINGALLHGTGGTLSGGISQDVFSATVNGNPIDNQVATAGVGPLTSFNVNSSTGVSAGTGTTLGITAVLTARGAGLTSFDSEITVPDAGMTLALLGSGLTGLALFARRKTA